MGEWEWSGPNIYEFVIGLLLTAAIFLALYGIGTLLFGEPNPWVLWVLWFTVWGNVEVKANR